MLTRLIQAAIVMTLLVAVHYAMAYTDYVPVLKDGEPLVKQLIVNDIPDEVTFIACIETDKELICKIQDLTKNPPVFNMHVPLGKGV